MSHLRRTYTELLTYDTFEERLAYLELGGGVGQDTFGFDRYLNQRFYKSDEWLTVRRKVLLRDNGCDLGVEGYEIFTRPLVHHMNPVRPEDLHEQADWVLDPKYLITVSHVTHNKIHYGINDDLMPSGEREAGDTKLW